MWRAPVSCSRASPTDSLAVTAQQLFAETLAGEEGKEVMAQTYMFPPGAVLPWHIHPDAHEICLYSRGHADLRARRRSAARDQGGAKRYIFPPNVVHRGMNQTDQPVKLFVVRIKPKDKPLVQEVPPPQ